MINDLYAPDTANFPRIATDALFSDPNAACRFEGIIDRTVKFITDFQLTDPVHWARFVEQFKVHSDTENLGWRGEYWGKMMRGASFVYGYTRDEGLYKVLTDTVLDMLSAEDELGRISSFTVEKEFDGWDIWSRKYVLLGMQYFMEVCDDKELCEKMTASMRRQADYMISKLGREEDGKKPITSASRHWYGLNSSSVLEPIVRLYSITGEKKYLDFAEYIVNEGGTKIFDIFELADKDITDPYLYPVVKAYEMMSCFEGLLEYYRVTGNEKYRDTVIKFAKRVINSDVTVIGSAGCTHELFDGSAMRQHDPALAAGIMQETCVTVTLMKLCLQLLSLTGDPAYADVFERALYNAYLGAVNAEKNVDARIIEDEIPGAILEPLPFDSYSALTIGTRGKGIGGLQLMPDNHYYGCCACIGAAGIGMVWKNAAMLTRSGVTVNLYIPGSIETKTPADRAITLKTATDYPADGKVKITLGLSEKESFTLSLRVPEWSRETEISVNGERVTAARGYTDITREWKNGDVIELSLDMRARVIMPIPFPSEIVMPDIKCKQAYRLPHLTAESDAARYQIAMERGPLVLARDARLGGDVREAVDIDYDANGYVKLTASDTADFDKQIEFSVPTKDGGAFKVIDYASAGKTWDERSLYGCWLPTVKPMY